MVHEPTRVLLFAMAFPPDAVGSGAFAYRLACGLAAKGYGVRVLAPEDRAGRWVEMDAVQAFQTVRFAARGPVLGRYWKARRWLRREIAGYHPDLVWTTNGMATRVVGFTPELDGWDLPILSSIRGSDITTRLPGRGPWARLESVYQRRCYARSTAIAAASEYLRRIAVSRGIDAQSIFINPPAFDFCQLKEYTFDAARLEKVHPALSGKPVLLTVARLVKQKRVAVVLEAVAHLRRRVPETMLVVVGDGPQRAALERRARRMGMADSVLFTGSVTPMSEALYDLYSAARVFVMAGVREGLGNVFVEAGALSTPSVGVDDGGVPEIIQDGRTGLLARPDDPVDLARKLENLLTNAETARRMGEGAHAWVKERFSTAAMLARSQRILQYVLHHSDGGQGGAPTLEPGYREGGPT